MSGWSPNGKTTATTTETSSSNISSSLYPKCRHFGGELYCCSGFAQSKFCSTSGQSYGGSAHALSLHQQTLASQQQPYVEASLVAVLDRVCVSMGCVMENLDLSEIVNDAPFQQQSVRIIATIDMFNVPILLDVLSIYPYRFALDGLEVHALEKPVKVQFRLSRTLFPKISRNQSGLPV